MDSNDEPDPPFTFLRPATPAWQGPQSCDELGKRVHNTTIWSATMLSLAQAVAT